MVEILFDTNILVDHMRGFALATPLISKVEEGKIIGYISTITEVELFAGEDAEDGEKLTKLLDLLSLFQKLSVDSTVAKKAGEFARAYGTKIPDAIIAATAFTFNCKLFTKNTKDFDRIKDVEIEAPY